MAAVPVVEEGISVVLERIAPDLRLVPDWVPVPDPPVPLGPLGQKLQWGDVFDWVKDETRHLIPAGREIDTVSMADVQNAIDASQGNVIKAMSGFIDQNAAMTVQAAELLEGAIDNVYANQIHDYQDLSTRIDALTQGQAFIAQVIVPTIRGEIAQAQAHAFGYALAAQQNAQQWATDNIFKPVYSELLKVQPAIDTGVDRAEKAAHVDAVAQVAGLAAAVGTAITPMRNALQALEEESDDCVKPMCETMGPKSDLGKLLKALSIAADLALLHELLNLDEDKLAGLIRSVTSHVSGIVGAFESLFVEGGDTIGDVIKSAL